MEGRRKKIGDIKKKRTQNKNKANTAFANEKEIKSLEYYHLYFTGELLHVTHGSRETCARKWSEQCSMKGPDLPRSFQFSYFTLFFCKMRIRNGSMASLLLCIKLLSIWIGNKIHLIKNQVTMQFIVLMASVSLLRDGCQI